MSSFCLPLMFRSRRYPLLLTMMLCASSAAQAINYTWNNTGTDWNSPGSWTPASGSGVPNSGGDVAIFNAAALSNPNISSSISISRITANSATSTGYALSSSLGATITLGATTTGTSSVINYTPSSGSLTVSAPIILGAAAGSTQSINVNSTGGTVSINGAISSTNSVRLQKSGSGTLILSSAANSYSGGTTISAGTLMLSGAGTLGSGDLTLSGGTFDISGLSAASYALGASLIGTGTIAGEGKILSTSALSVGGALTLSNVTLSLAGVSTFDFTSTDFAAGTFDLVQGSAGTADVVVFGGTLSLSFAGGTYSNGSSVRIFDVDTYSGAFSSLNYSGLGVGQSAIFDAATGYVTVVPEPEAWALFLLGAMVVGMKLVRHRRHQISKAL